MKYLCLLFFDEKKLETLSPEDSARLDNESLSYDQTLRGGGHFLAAQALEPVNAAVTVRLRNGRAVVTDGPFAETKEQIGGFILIEARDLNEAIQLASEIPVARFGGVELRPVMELKSSESARIE